MYEVIHQKNLPGHFYTNPSTIHFFLVHFFKKYYESHHNTLMSNTVLTCDCDIVDHGTEDGVISTIYYHQTPVVRLIRTNDEYEIHVLRSDISYKEAANHFPNKETGFVKSA